MSRPAMLGVLIGAAQLAIGRGAGIERFEGTVPAFLASLAPLVAFPLVLTVLAAMAGHGAVAGMFFLMSLVAQLTPPVLSHWLAVRWGRQAEWLRYATAVNWCQWAIPVVAFLALVVVQMGAGAAGDEAASEVLIVVIALYDLWLSWTIARHGLSLSRARAAGLVALVNAVTIVLVVVAPRMVASLVG